MTGKASFRFAQKLKTIKGEIKKWAMEEGRFICYCRKLRVLIRKKEKGVVTKRSSTQRIFEN